MASLTKPLLRSLTGRHGRSGVRRVLSIVRAAPRIVAGLALIVLLGWWGWHYGALRPAGTPVGSYAAAAELLDHVPARIESGRGGYSRAQFGRGWAVDHGCDTRNRILARDLREVTTCPCTHDCVVVSGRLADSYTGRTIWFDKSRGSEIDIDHGFPLERAWRDGAADWTAQRRVEFANDPDNLVAVAASANRSKGSAGPGNWNPRMAARCDHTARFVRVAAKYGLSLGWRNHLTARVQLGLCQLPLELPPTMSVIR